MKKSDKSKLEELKRALKEDLREHNPFMVIDRTGRLVKYKDEREAYMLIVIDLFTNFPLGFVDIPLFMAKRQGIKPCDWQKYCGEQQYVFITWWGIRYPHVYGKIRKLLLVLLKPSGFSLNEYLFVKALENLNKTIQLRDEAKSRITNNLFSIYNWGIENCTL